jgi:hypothetical protein
MLLPPVLIARPGDNHTPSGACCLSGSSSPGEGPYLMCHNGQFYSRSVVVDMAVAFGDVLVADTIAAKFEQLAGELAAVRLAQERVNEDAQAARTESARLAAELETALAERDRLHAEIAELRPVSVIVAEFLAGTETAETTKTKEGRRERVTA